ncbi:MAG: MHYT domain-containing protein [Streptosporangiaceae bacterium]|jgi:NO-binding membrane sensor protein with MHYT domain
MLPVHNFSFGILTPALGYVMSCLGAYLGLRCTVRARAYTGATRARWLLLAAVSIGTTGIWVMHFIAMLGYSIPGEAIRYNVPVTIASMFIAVAIVYVGLLIVGFGPEGTRSLLAAGVITGIGVAGMHYTGMAAMRMPARMTYNGGLLAVSVLIAIIAATAALWAALRLHSVRSTLGAALIMGVAVSGMHYTGMAAMHMFPAPAGGGMLMGGATAETFLLPLILGISILNFILTATIVLSPNDDEIRAEAELMDRIAQARSGRPAAAGPLLGRPPSGPPRTGRPPYGGRPPSTSPPSTRPRG